VREAGADYLAYLLIDSVVDAYFPVIEQFGERIQHLESAAIDDPSPSCWCRCSGCATSS